MMYIQVIKCFGDLRGIRQSHLSLLARFIPAELDMSSKDFEIYSVAILINPVGLRVPVNFPLVTFLASLSPFHPGQIADMPRTSFYSHRDPGSEQPG